MAHASSDDSLEQATKESIWRPGREGRGDGQQLACNIAAAPTQPPALVALRGFCVRCCGAERARPLLRASSMAQQVNLETSMGSITVELYTSHAPRTCKNFAELARRGYYDGIIFHRVIKDFMIQGGDPTGTGRGGESIYGKKFEDEITRELKHTGAGILSMANSGPNTSTAQGRIVKRRYR
eukprot:scaffold1634_cov353-Prasinococcus_capsulatus_cf.AAC.7